MNTYRRLGMAAALLLILFLARGAANATEWYWTGDFGWPDWCSPGNWIDSNGERPS